MQLINRSMKKMRIFTILVLFSLKCFAQTKYSSINKFNQSISKNLIYPSSLISEGKSIFTLLKVDVNSTGLIKSIEISDSADSLFKAEFGIKKRYLDTKSLSQFINQKGLKSISLLIQISVYFSNNKNINFENSQRLMKFSNVQFTGPAIILSPVDEGLIQKSEN